MKPFTDNYRTLAPYLSGKITQELKESYPGLAVSNELPATMSNTVGLTGNKFVIDSYWTETSAAEDLLRYISMSYAGLTKTVAELN